MNQPEPSHTLESDPSTTMVEPSGVVPEYGHGLQASFDSADRAMGQGIPWTVHTAIGLQVVDLFLTSLSLLGSLATDPRPGQMGSKLFLFVLSTCVYILLLWKLATRKDWARMILLNLTLLGCIFLIVGLVATDSVRASLLSVVFFVALRLISLVFLYLPRSNRWYDDGQSPN